MIDYLYEGRRGPLSGELTQGMEASLRFTSFVDTYRGKIRSLRDPQAGQDVRSELEAAGCLLNDRRLAVTYEPYTSAKKRGPD